MVVRRERAGSAPGCGRGLAPAGLPAPAHACAALRAPCPPAARPPGRPRAPPAPGPSHRRSSGRAQRRFPTRPSLLTGVRPAQAAVTASHTSLPCSRHDWCLCHVSTTLSFIYVSGSLHTPWLGTGGRPPPKGAPRFCSSMPARLSLSGGGRPLAEGARAIILQDPHSARDRRASR